MKNIIILITAILLSTNIVNAEEHKDTLADYLDDECYSKTKVSPDTVACSIKKGFRNLYTKEDGSLNFLGKFFNAKSLTDLKK